MNTYLSASDYARLHGVSRERVGQWIKRGRLPDAFRVGGRWFIPVGTPKPESLGVGGRPAHRNKSLTQIEPQTT